jgi:hypothetical protein
VLAWNGIDLLFNPVRGKPAAQPRLASAAVFGLGIGLVGGAVGMLGARATGRFSDRALRRAIGLALIAVALAFAVEVLVR